MDDCSIQRLQGSDLLEAQVSGGSNCGWAADSVALPNRGTASRTPAGPWQGAQGQAYPVV